MSSSFLKLADGLLGQISEAFQPEPLWSSITRKAFPGPQGPWSKLSPRLRTGLLAGGAGLGAMAAGQIAGANIGAVFGDEDKPLQKRFERGGNIGATLGGLAALGGLAHGAISSRSGPNVFNALDKADNWLSRVVVTSAP